ncbi:hypothetical protein L1987_08757 [Smallanthus sonchifolius]|uniref:Uncharacterized protein n=1 Tax=Smallanthus sonchifolius TaxID=185202 RepID=A0ACB9JL34_9ASTR|nr:hypothetical protein L1987_08757 [Smallanthus sonchifolius]
MSSANSENARFPPAMPHEEELDQVSELEPEEELEENQWETRKEQTPTPTQERLCRTQSPTGKTLAVRSDWVNFMGPARRGIARKTVLPPKKRALSSTDTESLPKRHCLLNQLEIGESSHQVSPQEVGPTEPTIPSSTERSEPQPDPGAQQSEDTSENSDAIIEALDDRLVQLQGVVDLNDSALGRLYRRVTMGETRLEVVEYEVIAAGQRDERADERLDSFAALTIVNTMLLAFVLLRGC